MTAVKTLLAALELGELREHANLAVLPLFGPEESGPDYLTLSAALQAGMISVTEIGNGGSVPELKVKNSGEALVLLLDGEELAGAKQNRVLNTTILLAAQSETIVPVSCTEQGRWSAVSEEFSDSGHVMNLKARARKEASVARALASVGAFRADQGEVWESVNEVAMEAKVNSPTGALRDVFTQSERELTTFLERLPCLQRQHGMIVFINGQPVGLDLLSRAEAYRTLHPKLMKSYALDALVGRKEADGQASRAQADALLCAAAEAQGTAYPSVGLGESLRFQGAQLVGSALVVDGAPVHLAFFTAHASEQVGTIASSRRRRGFRRG